MRKNNRKGFTIVELVIVIAVIAILAAVLIPTFVSLVNKANQSADQQAVTNMNKILLTEDKPENVDGVVAILIANEYAGDLTTYYAKYQLAWIAEENVIVLIENDAIVYPENYVDKGLTYELIKPMAKNIEDVLEALQDGGSVYVAENVTASTGNDLYFGSGNTVINLAGNTIYTNIPNTNYSTEQYYRDGISATDAATVTINGGNITAGENIDNVIAAYEEGSKVVVKDAVVSGGVYISVLAENGGTVEVNNSSIIGANTNPLQVYGGHLILNNVTAVHAGDVAGAESYYNSVIQVSNTIKLEDGAWKFMGNDASLEVNGGNYTGKVAIQINSPGGSVVINDGIFTGEGTDGKAINGGVHSDYSSQGAKCSVTINGGTFNGAINLSAGTEFVVKGGTFNTTNAASIERIQAAVQPGCTITLNGETYSAE